MLHGRKGTHRRRGGCVQRCVPCETHHGFAPGHTDRRAFGVFLFTASPTEILRRHSIRIGIDVRPSMETGFE